MNKIISSIHGNLCGDGSVYTFQEKRCKSDISKYNRKKQYRIRYGLTYTNNAKELLKKFRNNFKRLFPNVKINTSRENEVKIRNKKVYDFLIRFGDYHSRNWRIPKEIMRGSISIKIEWIKSFCDDEATIAGRRIRIDTVNKKGMRDLNRLLDSLNIKNKLVHYSTKSRVTIYDINLYYKLIGFDHPLKSNKLKFLQNP